MPISGSGGSGSTSIFSQPLFTPDPMLALPADPTNPLLFDEPIKTTGDVLAAYENLGRGLPGTKIMMSYGSFPGNVDASLPINTWDVDKKPDVIYIGDSDAMLAEWSKSMGWDAETLVRQQALAKEGLVYYNGSAESAQGPIPHKVGFIDLKALRSVVPGVDGVAPRGFPPGFFYLMYRASLLPMTDKTFRLIGASSAEMHEFKDLVSRSAAAYMGHAVDSFGWKRVFTGKDLARRRYFNQFTLYDWSRAFGLFEIRKGRKQFSRYQAQVPEIIAPAVRDYFTTYGSHFEIRLDGKIIEPSAITLENLYRLTFHDLRSKQEKRKAYRRVLRDSRWVQKWAVRQSKNAGKANAVSRRGPLTPSRIDYLSRKIGNAVGLAPDNHPRSYTQAASWEASNLVGLDNIASFPERLRSASQQFASDSTRLSAMRQEALDILDNKVERLAPEAYRAFYPYLEAALRDSGSRVQQRLDQRFVDQVGESPPTYRRPSGVIGFVDRLLNPFPHSSEFEQVVGSNSRSAKGKWKRNKPKPVGELSYQVRLKDSLQRFLRSPASRGEPSHQVHTAVWLRSSLQKFLGVDVTGPDGNRVQYKVLASRLPHIMAEASGIKHSYQLAYLAHDRWSDSRLTEWKNSDNGAKFLAENQSWLEDKLTNRFQDRGFGLVGGVLSLWGMETLADEMGLDAQQTPHERFMLVAGGAHLINGSLNSVNQVRLNRKLGMPFDFASRHGVNTGASWGWQHRVQARSSAPRAYMDALLQPYTMVGSPGSVAKNLAKATLTFPFRTSLNMGAGLLSAKLTDEILLSGILNLSPDSSLRHGLHTASFFAPDAYLIFVGERGMGLFRSAPVRLASRAFGYGMAADLGFSALNRLHFGAQTTFQNHVAQLANEYRDEAEGVTVLDTAFEWVAPQLAAWWDTTEGVSFKPNKYRRQVERNLRKQGNQIAQEAQVSFQRILLEGIGGERLTKAFYQKIDFSFLSASEADFKDKEISSRLPLALFAEDMSVRSLMKELNAQPGQKAKIRWVQERYCGWDLSNADVEEMFARMQTTRISTEFRNLEEMKVPELRLLSSYVDKNGILKSSRRNDFLKMIFTDAQISQTQLLRLRKLRLFDEVKRGRVANRQDLDFRHLEALAQELGLPAHEENSLNLSANFFA